MIKFDRSTINVGQKVINTATGNFSNVVSIFKVDEGWLVSDYVTKAKLLNNEECYLGDLIPTEIVIPWEFEKHNNNNNPVSNNITVMVNYKNHTTFGPSSEVDWNDSNIKSFLVKGN